MLKKKSMFIEETDGGVARRVHAAGEQQTRAEHRSRSA